MFICFGDIVLFMAKPKLSYNPDDISETTYLKISKSSFVLYNMCPRKYWWNYIALPDVRPPASEAMLRGSAIHKAMEPLIIAPTDPKMIKLGDKSAIKQGFGADIGYGVMKELLADLESKIGKWEMLQAEIKITIHDERKGVYLVGAMDGLLRAENGDIILVELKTGNFNDGKLSRTRRELAFYTYMLEHTEYPRPTHFLYIAPDATNEKMLNKLSGQKKKTVGFGLVQGMYVLEPISLRTINSFMKVYDRTVDLLKEQKFPFKWNDYFCTQYCDYVVQCEPEMMGLCEDPTLDDISLGNIVSE